MLELKKRIELIQGYDLLLYRKNKDFEIKIIDNFTGETLIIDNSFINKKALKLKKYRVLCLNITDKLINGYNLSQLSMQ